MDEKRSRLMLKQHNPTILAERYRQEIEQAIAKAKQGGRQKRAVKKWSQTEVSRFHYGNGRLWNDRKGARLRIKRNTEDERAANQSIIIRGKVPRAFFDWFERQRQTDWRHKKMLDNCFFEER